MLHTFSCTKGISLLDTRIEVGSASINCPGNLRKRYCMLCRGVGYKSDFMTYCTNKLYGLMFARELATRLKASPPAERRTVQLALAAC